MSIIYSHHVLLDSIIVNNTGNFVSSCKREPSHIRMHSLIAKANTDGADIIRSSHIKFNNWKVYNGDDSISLKANSTDISITNSHFYDGLGIAIGSIGQYFEEYETVERLKVENIYYHNTLHAVGIPKHSLLCNSI